MKVKEKEKANKLASVHPMSKEVRTYDLKIGNVLNKNFVEALRQLMSMPAQPKAAMRIKKLGRAVEAAAQKYIKDRDAIFSKYSKKDEKGELIVVDGQFQVKDEHLVVCNEELEALVSTTFPVPMVDIKELSAKELTAEMLGYLDGVVIEE